MNFVQHRGLEGFYLPSKLHEVNVRLPWISTPLRMSCNSNPVLTNGSLLFPIYSRRSLSSLVTLYLSPGEHGLPIFERKMATAILWSFSLPVGWHQRLRHRSFNSRLQPHYPITVVVGTRMTFYKMSSLSKAQAGGICTARFGLSPWPSTATVATRERRFGANKVCHLGFDCPRYTADTCTSFRQYFQP